MIRPFVITDFGALNRYRRHALFLDSQPTLTWGRALVPAGALLSPFSSLTGVFTSVSQGDGRRPPLMGQVAHRAGRSYAHFTMLAPEAAIESPDLPALLEHLIKRVGSRGAQSLVAEVEESSRAFEALRRAGFSIYTRQTIWRITRAPRGVSRREGWRPATRRDAFAVNLLAGSLVPTLVQQVEPLPADPLSGWLHYRNGELLAYVDLTRGPTGAWLQPYVHLDAAPFGRALAALVAGLGPSRGKPLYVCMRSNQEWLQPALEDLGAEPGPQQAVMVKRTTRRVDARLGHSIRAAEGRRAEPTVPIQLPNPIMINHELELSHHD